MLAHSIFGASSSTRIIKCPGSVNLSKDLPEKTSKYAEEGTLAHQYLEDHLLGKIPLEGVPEGEMREAVRVAVGYVKTVLTSKGKLFVEQRLSLPIVKGENIFGTVDILALEEDGTLNVIDFKYGKGVKVSPETDQLKFYGLASCLEHLDKIKKDKIILTIIQPRIEGFAVRSTEVSFKELVEWGKNFKNAILESKKENPKLETGEHCRFCKARLTCPLQKKQNDEVFRELSKASPKEVITQLTDEQIVTLISRKKVIEGFYKELDEYVLESLGRGLKIKGILPCKGRKTRRWVDGKKVIDLVGDMAYEKKVFTPPQMFKKVKDDKEMIAKLELLVSYSQRDSYKLEDKWLKNKAELK